MEAKNKLQNTLRLDPIYLMVLILPIIIGALITLVSDVHASFSWMIDKPKYVLWYIIIIPIVEEMAFRGFLQNLIEKHKPRGCKTHSVFSWANLITSLIFAGFHLINHAQVIALMTFIPSLIFGYFKDKYQNIVPGILLHSLYNLGFIALFVE